MREIERVRQFGFTASEYARAKADYLRSLEVAYNERDKQRTNSYVKEYVRHFIDNEPIPGIENEYPLMNQIVPNIPVEAVNQVMKQLIEKEYRPQRILSGKGRHEIPHRSRTESRDRQGEG